MFKPMFKVDPLTAAQVLASHQAQFVIDKASLGEATEFRCHCGGVMHRYDPTKRMRAEAEKKAGKPRYSRRKRQMKKNVKRWRQSKQFDALLLACLVTPLRNPMGFMCSECGSREGFYSMMAKSMFQIQPMPEGAKVIY